MSEMLIDKFPSGIITPPPSKSLSHRALICAALAGGEAAIDRIENMGVSQDISATRNAVLRVISGENGEPIDCGESGSTLRFLIPVAAALGAEWRMTGGGRLLERPLFVYEELFRESGSELLHDGNEIRFRGQLTAGRFALRGDVSSQFVSGLLLALPLLDGDSEIMLTTPLESSAYADMTISVMRFYGVSAEKTNGGYFVSGRQRYRLPDSGECYRVEADYSQAAFFLGAAALGCDIAVSGLNPDSLQGDRRIIEILRDMGADVHIDGGLAWVGPEHPRLKGITLDISEIPDLAPPIAALAALAEGRTWIKNASRLRIKESDRISATVEMLGALGADVREEVDALELQGRERLRGGRSCAQNDHRIAMAAALAAIGCDNPVLLEGSEAVNKSYPDFWRDWKKSEMR
jgi:3-phosphoshikimate 1-carboxyvinyltransferase